ncbi:type II toxin-antitoxin system HipA family toxin [Chitinophaga deserti]|uniref:type II toxin-antitoxin system HipA family toxin n=1 Tax=Chitinophaga deserti TaxID=2164099 RepID=UPI000D6C98DE|nr:type II toxin-antitoxin system HipA family toxin [Chitinophaga deserti]
MAKNDIITINAFGEEIGRVGYDEDQRTSSFQYNPNFLQSGKYVNIFPNIIKRIPQVQVFRKFDNEHFRGLPPMIADSLPDSFGNTIFRAWLDANDKDYHQISVIEQLAYVSNRGMGALEYFPGKIIPKNATINLDEIIGVLEKVLSFKGDVKEDGLNTASLLNVFKIGTSAGGARPKILISEHKETGQIIPGDLEYSDAYNHYLVKLSLEENPAYSVEALEYAYYLTAQQAGIDMMDSHMIDNRHFATKRFDRQDGRKQHILTASGITGWAYSGSPVNSRYENLFKLALHLKLPHRDIEQLYRRMVFNVVYANTDDHLKNHSFIYDDQQDLWRLSPAYDVTYSLNPMLNVTRSSRALSINGKRTDIDLNDLIRIAEEFTIKSPKGIIEEVQSVEVLWQEQLHLQRLPERVIRKITGEMRRFEL